MIVFRTNGSKPSPNTTPLISHIEIAYRSTNAKENITSISHSFRFGCE